MSVVLGRYRLHGGKDPGIGVCVPGFIEDIKSADAGHVGVFLHQLLNLLIGHAGQVAAEAMIGHGNLHTILKGQLRHLQVGFLVVQVIAGYVVDIVDSSVGHGLIMLVGHIILGGRPEDGDHKLVAGPLHAVLHIDSAAGGYIAQPLGQRNGRFAGSHRLDQAVLVHGSHIRPVAAPGKLHLIGFILHDLCFKLFGHAGRQKQRRLVDAYRYAAHPAKYSELRELHQHTALGVCGSAPLGHIEP